LAGVWLLSFGVTMVVKPQRTATPAIMPPCPQSL
jgi:hypothetical protein